MNFQCSRMTEDGLEKWPGRIVNIINYGSHYEMKIESRSGIVVVLGETRTGYFACIPEWDAGCHLAKPSDLFWNTEQLVRVLGEVDGITVACAIEAIAPELKFRKKDVNFY